jgi:hypothetical protein
MEIVFFDGLNFSGLARTFKFLPSYTQRPAYGMLMVSYEDRS